MSCATSFLLFKGYSWQASFERMVTLLVSTAKPAPASLRELSTMKSKFFLCSLAVAFSCSACVSRAKPTRRCPSRFICPSEAAMSCVGFSWMFKSLPLRLIFSSATSAGVKSATAAQRMAASASG